MSEHVASEHKDDGTVKAKIKKSTHTCTGSNSNNLIMNRMRSEGIVPNKSKTKTKKKKMSYKTRHRSSVLFLIFGLFGSAAATPKVYTTTTN